MVSDLYLDMWVPECQKISLLTEPGMGIWTLDFVVSKQNPFPSFPPIVKPSSSNMFPMEQIIIIMVFTP